MKSFLVLIALVFGVSAFAVDKPTTGTVVWFDVRVTDFAKAEDFYGKLFGWQFQEIFSGYKMISSGGKGVGGFSISQKRDNTG